MNKTILWASAVGFLVPVFWIVLSFILFTVRESKWTDIYWDLVHFTCPVWNLQGLGGVGLVMVPVANAILYGLIAFLSLKIRRSEARQRPTNYFYDGKNMIDEAD